MIVITVMSRKTDIKVDTVFHINHAVVGEVCSIIANANDTRHPSIIVYVH